MGLVPASSNTEETGGWQMRQCCLTLPYSSKGSPALSLSISKLSWAKFTWICSQPPSCILRCQRLFLKGIDQVLAYEIWSQSAFTAFVALPPPPLQAILLVDMVRYGNLLVDCNGYLALFLFEAPQTANISSLWRAATPNRASSNL